MTRGHIGKGIIIFISSFVLGGILLLWAWNSLGELFGWPHALFKHTLAAEFLIGTIGLLISLPFRAFQHRHSESK